MLVLYDFPQWTLYNTIYSMVLQSYLTIKPIEISQRQIYVGIGLLLKL